MAVYKTITKNLIIRPDNSVSTTVGSSAAIINDYIETLDSTSGTILWIETTELVGGDVLVTIISTEA